MTAEAGRELGSNQPGPSGKGTAGDETDLSGAGVLPACPESGHRGPAR